MGWQNTMTMSLAIATVTCTGASHPRPALTHDVLHAVNGGLILETTTGNTYANDDLVGGVIDIGGRKLLVESIKHEGPVVLFGVEVELPEGKREEFCNPDPDGNRLALAVEHSDGSVEMVCSSGAMGKCVRWGYAPPVDDSAKSPRRQLYEACVRMVRADYGGDGTSWTRDGTRISFCDALGVYPCPHELELEAAWSDAGAVCVHNPRIEELGSLAELEDRYPRLQEKTGTRCTLAWARSHDALLFTRMVARN